MTRDVQYVHGQLYVLGSARQARNCTENTHSAGRIWPAQPCLPRGGGDSVVVVVVVVVDTRLGNKDMVWRQ